LSGHQLQIGYRIGYLTTSKIMIKEIKTEKFEGLAMLMPNWFVSAFANMGYLVVQVQNEKTFMGEDQMFPPDRLQRALDRVNKLPENITLPAIKLPDGDFKILGKATQLTEEQCEEVIPDPMIRKPDNRKGFMIDIMDTEIYPTAKEAFSAFLDSLGCYSVNPYKKPADDDYSFYTDRNISIQEEWQEAQANTGTWLILQKL
jgi:hypothetical protein